MTHIGPEIPLTLLLMATLGLRARVRPRASLLVKATSETLWRLLEPFDGKTEQWSRTRVSTRLIDPVRRLYEITYSTAMANGTLRPVSAMFSVAELVANQRLVLKREGLEGQSEKNQLLQISHELVPEAGGVRIRTEYLWGSRSLLAQLLARADLWGGAYRLKALAETGKPNDRAYFIISALVALVTGLISLLAFGYSFGMGFAAIVVFALLVHEFGHLLAFKLIGQPWGRVVFLPFLGAIAVPRMAYQSQGEAVFAALMGPGFSCLLALGCMVPQFLGWQHALLFAVVGAVTAGLNVFNMLPAEPLDGGIALRSILARLMGKWAWFGLLATGLAIAVAGYLTGQLIFALFGALAVLVNFGQRRIDIGLTPLSTLQVCIALFAYVSIAAAHYTLMFRFIGQLGI